MREAAVLVAVFIPLDLALQDHALTIGWGVAIVVLPLMFFAIGAAIELKRRS